MKETTANSGLATMLALVAELPEQLSASASLPGLAELSALQPPPRQIVLCGMGGSAAAGALLQAPLAAASIQLTVWRDYGLPGWVTGEDLVIAASYSGDTEETLSAAREAQGRGCRLLAITTGGALLAASAGNGDADASGAGDRSADRSADRSSGQGDRRSDPFTALRLPAGLPPRAALGLALGALLHGLDRYGLAGDLASQLPAAIAELRRQNARLRDPGGAAAEVAAACQERFVVIYTSGAMAHAAGERLKAQLNENSKTPACCARFPELDHNDIVGWRLPPQDRDRYLLLLLRGGDESARDKRRVQATLELLAEDLPRQYTVQPEGASDMARLLSLVQFGDYLSCHLAAAKGVDPLPVARIESLKTLLSKG